MYRLFSQFAGKLEEDADMQVRFISSFGVIAMAAITIVYVYALITVGR